MNDLPTRHEAKKFVLFTFTDDSHALVPAIVRAYAIGDLMTREEFVDSLDMEAAAKQAWRREMNAIPEIKVPKWDALDELERAVYLSEARENIMAALGEDTK